MFGGNYYGELPFGGRRTLFGLDIVPASETDAATQLNPLLASASETDSAQRLALPLRPALEADTAQALGTVNLQVAAEADAAQALVVHYGVVLTPVSELDAAQWFSPQPWCLETDTARVLVVTSGRQPISLLPPVESDAAQVLVTAGGLPPGGKSVLADVAVEINGVLLSASASVVQTEAFGEEIDVTPLGSKWRVYERGFCEATVSITFWQDFAVVDAVLAPLVESDQTVTVRVVPTSSPHSTVNPPFTITGLVTSYTPLVGGMGAGAVAEVVFRNVDPAPFGDRELLAVS